MLGLIVAGWIVLAQGNPIVSPPQPSEIHVTNTTVVNVPPMDPQAVEDASVVADRAFIVNVAQPVPVEWANQLCTLPDLWRTTPPQWTYNNGQLGNLSKLIAAAASALLVFAIFAQGLGHALREDMEPGRIFAALILSAGNLWFWQIAIDLNNGLTAAIGAPDLCNSLVKPHLNLEHPDPAASLAGVVLVVVYAFVAILLMFSLGMRLGLLDVLIAVGPLAMMCFAHEKSAHIGQWYMRLSIGTLYGQVLLVVGLTVAGVITGIGQGLAGTLLGLAVLFMCRGLLGALSSQNVQSRGSGMAFGMAFLVRKLIAKL